ncbi:uncharacterized protein B0I36DRAFT_328580 [Microdochium trichocladiopsis]|uniref:Fe2OG dioxygenase domain-containing protein n=1 Tax=Microdochium trichocladiopsis TaxID=1682393 RepID=A0A9P8Y3B7_9PEZI|nr:uncharacterized protein B0I36DRAFT_328580 [Microdochium trichocladiopsis]KAH7028084.1 hypothetical protein B0I36DRAFT_328580 [Microdochium trichocladiopsis]
MADDISNALSAFLLSGQAPTFACGGTIPVALGSSRDEPHTSPPVTVRWDCKEGANRISFPLNDDGGSRLSELIEDCVPATFGKDNEDVLDPAYRRAAAMDASRFAVDLDPYRLGIIDQVQRVLVPPAFDTEEVNLKPQGTTRSVSAELYKLNVSATKRHVALLTHDRACHIHILYSLQSHPCPDLRGPIRLFQEPCRHPRHETQIGSLVVCVPCHHKGGSLVVRHADREVTFDWSDNTTAIKWAAFYSDCEHEIMNVTEGFRVTLTYNLYVRDQPSDRGGFMEQGLAPVEVRSLPLYQVVRSAAANPEYMKTGGTLGIFCAHAYPVQAPVEFNEGFRRQDGHEDAAAPQILPIVLKGTDLAVVSVFRALGMRVEVKSILDGEKLTEKYYYCDGSGGEEKPEAWSHKHGADKLGRVCVTSAGGWDGAMPTDMLDEYGSPLQGVTWLTQRSHNNVDFVHLTYGNEVGISTCYTGAAILVKVPPFEERQLDNVRE